MKGTGSSFVTFLVILILLGYCCAERHGHQAETLHFAKDFHTATSKSHPQKNTVTLTVPQDESPSQTLRRVRRAAATPGSTTEASITPNVTTKFLFNDSHHQMMVHWAGAGSPIILTLARDIRPMSTSSSQLYISYNYGKTFKPVQLRISCPGRNRTGRAGLIEKFYHSDNHNSHYVFPDTVHNVLFLTKDFGETVTQACLNFKPTQVSIHPDNSDIILAMDENDPRSRLWGTQNFGITWFPVQENVKSFYWGVAPWDKKYDIYIERMDPMGNVVFKQNGIGSAEEGIKQPKSTILDHVVDFEVREEYMFATRRVNLLGSRRPNGTLQLWVSHQRGQFQNAKLPPEVIPTDFYIADASEHQVFLCVVHNDTRTDLYISEVAGTSFVLSLKNIVYFNPKHSHTNGWLRWYAKESFADIHKVDGLRSVYIASKLFNSTTLSVENQQTLISYDKGGLWEPVMPPARDSDGTRFNCSWSADPKYGFLLMRRNCSLHFSQLLSKWYPGIHTEPILSHESAPGIIMASGVVGAKLDKKTPEDVFVSADAGSSWNAVLKGHYMYEFGDHGGLIVAVKQYHLTRRLEYSWNEGQTWETIYFSDEDIHVYGLLTEPGEMTTVFSVFGSRPGHHSWAIIQVDLKSIFPYTCGSGDYKDWSPGENMGNECLLGKKRVYQRRIAHAKCFNGRSFDREISERNCSCTRMDYECDFGFVQKSNDSLECIADPYSHIDPDKPPTPCIGTYDRTRGYRKISGDSCSGGEEHRYGPDKFVCPLRNVSEFLLYTTGSIVKRYLFGTNSTERMTVPELNSRDGPMIWSMDYDYKRNCMYYSDRASIKSVCYEGTHRVSVLTTAVTSVLALRYDWMGDNLVWFDSGRGELAVSKVDGRFKRILLTNHTGTGAARLGMVRSLALAPAHGYIFLSDVRNHRLVRVDMDGQNARVIYNATQSTTPRSVSYDPRSERVFMVQGLSYGMVSSMRADGTDYHVLARGYYFKQVAVYKEYIVWADSRSLKMASKYSGSRPRTLMFSPGNLADMVAVHPAAQQGTNACSARSGGCSHLCLARPESAGQHGANRTCLCPQSFPKRSVLPDGNERCLCDRGEVMNNTDGQCHSVNKTQCSTSMSMCGSGRCIPRAWLCDHDDDCGDMTDETNCEYQKCPDGMFRCNNNRCIPRQWKCDHDNDCHDGSDELNCHYASCNTSQFTCDNGRCISERWRCDFDNDCHDHSDERDCSYNATTVSPDFHHPCNSTSFRCGHGRFCVPAKWKCDGADDCYDGSDERGCNTTAISSCDAWQFLCHSGDRCIQRSWVCDGGRDCSDGSDEQNCATTRSPYPPMVTTRRPFSCRSWEFTCYNGNCISLMSRCDRVNDCGDGSDEDGCHGPTPTPACARRGLFQCSDGVCLPMNKKCDGYPDCGDSLDEMNCHDHHSNRTTCLASQYTCDDGWCIHENWVCDGEADCSRGEDERNCTATQHCAPPRFQCLYSDGCIPSDWLCDGDRDCEDGSDEYRCANTTTPTVWSTAVPPTRGIQCGRGRFMCADMNFCVYTYMVCNGVYDCLDGSDERSCQQGEVYVRYLHVADKTYNSIHVRWVGPQHSDDGQYKFIPSIYIDNHWHNSSTVEAEDYTFRNLIGGTAYDIKVYVRFVRKPVGKAKPVTSTYFAGRSIRAGTPEGPPGAPVLLAPQVEPDGSIVMKWKKPNITNGVLTQYTLRVVDKYEHVIPYPVNSGLTTYRLPPRVFPEADYNISITAATHGGESVPSNYRTLHYHIDLAKVKVTHLNTSDIKANEVSLTWGTPSVPVSDFVNYVVEIFPNDGSILINTTTQDTKFTATGLTSGTMYQAFVFMKTKRGTGPYVNLVFNTKGQQPPLVEGVQASLINNNVLQVQWNSPKVKPQEGKWTYTVYYDYRGENMMNHTVMTSAKKQTVTGSTMVTIKDLVGCEEYFIRVQITGPNGLGPLTRDTSVRTSYDPSHKPKHLSVAYERRKLIVTWSVDCDFIVQPLAYIIRVTENKTSTDFKIPMTKNSTVRHEFTKGIVRGAVYGIAVRADVAKAQFSDPFTARIPSLSSPSNLRLQLLTNQDILLSWEYPDDTCPNTDIGCAFEIYFAHRHDNQSSPFALLALSKQLIYGVSREELYDKTLKHHNDVKPSMEFLFKVRAVNKVDYPGEFSATKDVEVDLTYHAAHPGGQHSPLTQANWLAVTIAGVVVVLALAVALVVYIVRHRRLQRSFMMFANSRYDAGSGTTTFSTGDDDLDDEDAPMITGFSDDEPLVIA